MAKQEQNTFDFLFSIVVKMNNLVVYNRLKPTPIALADFHKESIKAIGSKPQVLSVSYDDHATVWAINADRRDLAVANKKVHLLNLIKTPFDNTTNKTAETESKNNTMMSNAQQFIYEYLSCYNDQLFDKKTSQKFVDQIDCDRFEKLVEALALDKISSVRLIAKFPKDKRIEKAVKLSRELRNYDSHYDFWAKYRKELFESKYTRRISDIVASAAFIELASQPIYEVVLNGYHRAFLNEFDQKLTEAITLKADHMDCDAPFVNFDIISHSVRIFDYAQLKRHAMVSPWTSIERHKNIVDECNNYIDKIVFDMNHGKMNPILDPDFISVR